MVDNLCCTRPHLIRMIDFKINPTIARFCVLLIPWILTLAWLKLSRPPRWRMIGALLAFLWQLPALFLINAAAVRLNLWSFYGTHMLFFGTPVDLVLGWAALWGGFWVLAFHRLKIQWMLLLALLFDLIIIPLLSPLIQLGKYWLIGEALLLALALLPALILARWTEQRTHLEGRMTLIAIGWAGLFLFLLPGTLLAQSGGDIFSIFALGIFETIIALLLLLPPIALAFAAVREFTLHGGGTPLPFDPPKRLIITGPYAYVSNPMQLATLIIYIIMACIYSDFTLLLIPIVLWIFSIGFTWWYEGEEMRRRFGKSWSYYRKKVPSWVPRWQPYLPKASTFKLGNDSLSLVFQNWLGDEEFTALDFKSSTDDDSKENTSKQSRSLYRASDGAEECGLSALAHALEHIHILYAWLGWILRLPILRPILERALTLLIPSILSIQTRRRQRADYDHQVDSDLLDIDPFEEDEKSLKS